MNSYLNMSLQLYQTIQFILKNFLNKNWISKDFLTEDDVRCRLFECFKKALKKYQNISIHSEIRWYGDKRDYREEKMTYRSDIVILDSNDLNANEQNSNFKMPSKGYSFNKYYAIIEIKLRRLNNKDSDKKYNEIVKEDIKKLRKIKEKTNGGGVMNKKYFVLVFDKKRNRKSLIDIDNFQNIVWSNWLI